MARWLINREGRMFGGRINIIDLAVVLFISSFFVGVGYAAWKINRKPPRIVTPQINWEQKYNQAQLDCEKRRTQDLQGWQKRYDEIFVKYNAEIAQKEAALKKHPRLKKYFK